MAEVVLGLGTAHSPQLSVPWTQWELLRQKDETDTRLDYAALVQRAPANLDQQLTPDVWQQRYEACQQAIGTLGDVIQHAAPDIVVIFGDDQHEQFLDDNLPALAIYHGPDLPVLQRHRRNGPAWMV